MQDKQKCFVLNRQSPVNNLLRKGSNYFTNKKAVCWTTLINYYSLLNSKQTNIRYFCFLY